MAANALSNLGPHLGPYQIYDRDLKALNRTYPFLTRNMISWFYDLDLPLSTEITILDNDVIGFNAGGIERIPDLVAQVKAGPLTCTELHAYSDGEIFNRLNFSRHTLIANRSKMGLHGPIQAGVLWLYTRRHPVEYLTESGNYLSIQDIPPSEQRDYYISKSAASVPCSVMIDKQVWILLGCYPQRTVTQDGHLRVEYTPERIAQEITDVTSAMLQDPEVQAHEFCYEDVVKTLYDSVNRIYCTSEFAEVRSFFDDFFARKENNTPMLIKTLSEERDMYHRERDMYHNERDAAYARCDTLTLERDAAYAKIAELERRLAGFQR